VVSFAELAPLAIRAGAISGPYNGDLTVTVGTAQPTDKPPLSPATFPASSSLEP
jgi:hypothetical protein